MFLWNLPSDCDSGTFFHLYQEVSILVFVELALGHKCLNRIIFTTIGFNPCFCGTCPRTWAQAWSMPFGPSFNPCFCGTCPRTRGSRATSPSRESSFNPCFCGTCPRTEARSTKSSKKVPFQSLFLWNLPSDVTPVYRTFSYYARVSILVFVELALGP